MVTLLLAALLGATGQATGRSIGTSSTVNVSGVSSKTLYAPGFGATDPAFLSSFFGPVYAGSTLKGVDILGCADVRAFGAVGSALATTGTIGVGSASLVVASAIDFQVGQSIYIYAAGPGGVNLTTTIVGISGTTITLAAAAGNSVAGVAVSHDDTAAIQAAINSGPATGGPVCFPSGYYPVTSTLTLRRTSSLQGYNWSSRDAVNGEPNVSTIDCSTILNATCINTVGHSVGVVIEGLRIKGPTTAVGANSVGIMMWSVAGPVVRSVNTTGFDRSLVLSSTQGALVQGVWTDVSQSCGLDVDGSGGVTVLGSLFANVTGGGTDRANIRVGKAAASSDVLILTPIVDEAFNGASSVLILNADKVTLQGARVYYTHASGAGYGVRLGNGTTNPTNVTLRDITVQRYGAGPAPLAGIQINGSGHKLSNVKVDVSADSGAVGISDLASDTRWDAVTVTTTGSTIYTAIKDPNMPTINPGAGSNAIWADPADSYRLKWAN